MAELQNYKLVRCKDCKYSSILKTNKICRIDLCRNIQVEVPRECKNFERRKERNEYGC